MKKRFFLNLILSVSLLGGLASCGESSGNTSNANTSNGGSTGDITINFWHTFGQGIVEEFQSKAEDFKALVKQEEGVDINFIDPSKTYQGSYDDIKNKVTKSFATGTTPDIAIAYPDHVAEYLSLEETKGEYVVNLDTYINDPEIGLGKESAYGDDKGVDDLVTSFYEEGQKYAYEGTYSFPLMKSTEVMFYNVEAVSTALKIYDESINTQNKVKEFMNNVTWDELFEVAKVAKENKSQVMSSMETPIVYDSDSNLFISKMLQNDIPFISVDQTTGKGRIDFESGENRTKAEAMVTEFKNYHDQGLLTTKGTIGTYGSDSFKEGKCIITVGSSGGTGYNAPTGGSFTVGVCKVPASNNNPLYVSQGPTMVLLKNRSNPKVTEYAWKFMKYLTSTQNNVDLCIYGSQGYVPVRKSSYDTEDYLEYMQEGEIYADSARVVKEDINGRYLSTAVFKGSAVVRDEVGGIIAQVLTGSRTVSGAFDYAIQQSKLAM